MEIDFKKDYGKCGCALGTFDPQTDMLNINLEALYIVSLTKFYGCYPEPPLEFQDQDAFENYLIKLLCHIIDHEIFHKILHAFDDGIDFRETACDSFDHIENLVLEGDV